MKTIVTTLCAVFALTLAACSNGGSGGNTPAPGITGTNLVLPDTNGPPAQLNDKFDTGQCNVKTLVRSTGTGTDMSINGIAHKLYDHQRIVSTHINDLYTQRWGREGEYAICAQVLNPASVPLLEAELNQLVSDYTGVIRGVVSIDTN